MPPSPATEPVAPGAQRRVSLAPLTAAFTLALLLGLQPVTTDMMVVALPSLAADLRAPMAPVQLTMSALIFAFGVAQLVWGPVADRLGRRPVLLVALTLYLASALGAMLAGTIAEVIAARAVQGAAVSAAVVCARAMVRDLYAPTEGAQVMARALGGLGVLAIAAPLVSGVLVSGAGWRASLAAMAVVGALALGFVAWRLPETIPLRHRDATRLGPLAAQTRRILAHPTFRAWTILVALAYGGLYTFVAGSGFILIRVLGIAPARAGVIVTLFAISYTVGTFLARRWIPHLGLAGAVRRAAWCSAIAGVAFAVVALLEIRQPALLMAPVVLYALGHGVHQPCGQTGAVGPFPRAAGLASALAGFATAVVAFAVGLYLGAALDAGVRPFAAAMSVFAVLTALVALTAVQRHGDRMDG